MNKAIFTILQYIKNKKRNYSINPIELFELLNKSQYWSSERILDYQLKKLNELLIYARENSKYYSSRLEKIKLPLKSLKEFNNLIPPIDKSQIIENIDEIKTKNFTNHYKHSTSGSSGDPLSIFISEKAEVYRKAGFNRFKNWWGIKPYEKSVLIWSYDRANENYLSKIKTFLRARYDINVYKLDNYNIKKHFEYIEKFKPSYIRGYKSGIVEFAELLKKNNLFFSKAKFKVAIVTAEILYKEERKLIEKMLNCKVANEYGSADAGLFAYECPEGSMHINEESVYIDVKENSSVNVTELFNYSMPLINYKNNDEIIISNKDCSCGRTSRLIKEVKGRTSGYILKPDGTTINQGVLVGLFTCFNEEKPNSIRKFKVYQNKNNFKIKIVPLENFDSTCQDLLINKFHKEIGKEINIEFELVNNIKREKSGKLVYFVRQE